MFESSGTSLPVELSGGSEEQAQLFDRRCVITIWTSQFYFWKLWHAMKPKTFDGKNGLHTASAPSSSEGISDDPVLEPKHKIFLSHNGAQKEFVDHLCQALEERCHYPFFDRRPESLPKGKKFPDLILKAVQQCQLFVVVISEDYFMSKWPMIELDAFVKVVEKKKSSMNQGILPLFYGLSVSELKDEKRRQRWFGKWETFAAADSKGLIRVEDWKHALDELTKFNGLPYDRELKQVVEYESAIVSHVCKLVPPDIKWEDSHVQGNAHEVVIEKMKQVQASQWAKVKVVGLYGVGGIGKTTICKTLCNELSNDFEGRVCHIEFDITSANSKDLLQKVLIKLTRKSQEVVQQLDEGECKNILYKNLMKQKTFLAIDNVWDNAKSVEKALVFLQAPFHRDSLVLVTTRPQRTLDRLGVDGVACLEMPELRHIDATKLLLHYASNGQQLTSKEEMSFVDLCVERCYFSKGNGRGFHYHPLALEALGRQLGCQGKNPFERECFLSSMWNFSAFSGEYKVFEVLRISFDLLRPIEQDLFMDVGIFLRHLHVDVTYDQDLIGWSQRLCGQYKQNEHQMQYLLESLKEKGLIQDTNLSLQRVNMHDLYCEFLILEAKGKLVEAKGIGNRRWVHVDVQDGDLSEIEFTPAGGCWQNLTRFSIRQDDDQSIANPLESLGGIEWQYFSNVLVLQLYGLNTIKGALNLKGMKCLRSLQIHGLSCVDRLEGLERLTNLTLFEWMGSTHDSSDCEVIAGRLPRSLKYLDMRVDRTLLGQDVLTWCSNLRKLKLMRLKVGIQLDLSNCSSLECVDLCHIHNLQILLVPSIREASKLQTLNVGLCFQIVNIQGLDQLTCLKHFSFCLSGLKEVPNLLSLTNLQSLGMNGGTRCTKIHIPCQLQKFYCSMWWGLNETLNLNGFNHLQDLNLSWSLDLTCMSEMGDLPALRALNLSHCNCLRRLPDLSKSRNLEELVLDGCDTLELYDEDIQALAALPLLHPVHFSSSCEWGRKLDLGRRKVLQYMGNELRPPKSWLDWMEGDWEEKELGRPPIKVRDHDFGNSFEETMKALMEDICRRCGPYTLDSDSDLDKEEANVPDFLSRKS